MKRPRHGLIGWSNAAQERHPRFRQPTPAVLGEHPAFRPEKLAGDETGSRKVVTDTLVRSAENDFLSEARRFLAPFSPVLGEGWG